VQRELADITLWWIKERAASCGLSFGVLADGIDTSWITGRLHHSDTGLWRLLPPYIRPIGQTDPKHECAASTAVDRLEMRTYAPSNLKTFLADTEGTMVAPIATQT
jgi:hypothetical protein